MGKKKAENVVEETTAAKAREVVRHAVPTEYDGRCASGVFISTHLRNAGKLPDGLTMHKYEIRLPIPENDSECREFYGLTLEQMVRRAVLKIATEMDDSVKKVLFANCAKGKEAILPDHEHVSAQKVADNWRWSPRPTAGKTVSVSTLLTRLKAAGKLPSDVTADNAEELMELLAGIS